METKPTLSQASGKADMADDGGRTPPAERIGWENAAAGEESKDVIEYAHGITEQSLWRLLRAWKNSILLAIIPFRTKHQ